MDTFLAFLGITIIVIVTLGPDTAVTTRNVFAGVMRGGVFTALGVATGAQGLRFVAPVGSVAARAAPYFRQTIRGLSIVWPSERL